MKSEKITINKGNYKWQCRRGMLELDLLLNNFVDKAVFELSSNELKSFELLLSYPDQTLFDLLLGKTISSDNEISNIVDKIQKVPFETV